LREELRPVLAEEAAVDYGHLMTIGYSCENAGEYALAEVAFRRALALERRAPRGRLGQQRPGPAGERRPEHGDEHRAQPRVVTISQVTEWGTCYSLEELKSVGEFCRAEGLRLYIDGARLANAAAHLGCSLAELAAQADVLSFGGTKNGAVGAEAVVVMAGELTADAPFLRKQQGQLASKMRFLAAQFEALLDGQLWLRNASHANAMALRLAEGIAGVPGVKLWQTVESNAVFAALDPRHIERLQRDGHFYAWDAAAHVVRWMTAFDTTETDVDAFVADIKRTAGE